MGGVAHGEVVALDGALEALALGDTLDVDLLANGKDVRLDFATDGVIADLGVLDANSHRPRPASTLALAKWPASGLFTRAARRAPTVTCTAL